MTGASKRLARALGKSRRWCTGGGGVGMWFPCMLKEYA